MLRHAQVQVREYRRLTEKRPKRHATRFYRNEGEEKSRK